MGTGCRNKFKPINPIRAAFLEPCKARIQRTIPVLATGEDGLSVLAGGADARWWKPERSGPDLHLCTSARAVMFFSPFADLLHLHGANVS
jgi:hypothetical protein